ncbi:MAG: hypothetical protein Q7K34_01770 [archaeon]|nr:hypothetical protein [archaeon]
MGGFIEVNLTGTQRKYPWETDSANWYRLYPGLKVPVHAPRKYFKKNTKSDEYSEKIIESKTKDLSDYFLPALQAIISHNRFQEIDLLIVLPSSKIDEYSPTLLPLAVKLAKKNSFKNENIIKRIKETKKFSYTASLYDRYTSIKDTMVLTRKLDSQETNILLLDDTKTTGIHLLECAKLLKKSKSTCSVTALCLGINEMGGK